MGRLLKVDCDVNERPQVFDYDENSVQARRNHHTFVLALQQVRATTRLEPLSRDSGRGRRKGQLA